MTLNLETKATFPVFTGRSGENDIKWREWDFTLRAYLAAREMDVKVYLPTKDEDVPPMKIAVPQMDGNHQPVVNQQGQPILIEQESSNAKNLRWLFGFLALQTADKAKRLIQEAYQKHGENGAWAYLELRKRFIPDRIVCKHELLQRFFSWKMIKDDLDDALGDFSYLVSRLHEVGSTVPDETMIAVMLSALPERFDMFKATMAHESASRAYRGEALTWPQFEEALRNANDRMKQLRREQRDRQHQQRGRPSGRQHDRQDQRSQHDDERKGWTDRRPDNRYNNTNRNNGNGWRNQPSNTNRQSSNYWRPASSTYAQSSQRTWHTGGQQQGGGQQQQTWRPTERRDKDGDVIMNNTRARANDRRNDRRPNRQYANQFDVYEEEEQQQQGNEDFATIGAVEIEELANEVVHVNSVCSSSPKAMMMDTGAARSCCFEEQLFEEIKPLDHDINVIMANGSTAPAMGVGCIKFTCGEINKGKKKVMVDNVLYVPKLKFNLLSLAHLIDDYNVKLEIDHSAAFLKSKRGDMYPLMREGRFWYLNIYKDPSDCPNATDEQVVDVMEQPHTPSVDDDNEEPTDVMTTDVLVAEVVTQERLHQRFAHVNDGYLKKLPEVTRHAPTAKKENNSDDEKAKCEVCLKAKMKRLPYAGDAYRHQHPGDLIHVDLSQIKQPSERGYKYLMVVVDDASRWLQTYFLKKKSDAPAAFIQYCTAVRMPKAVRTDGGAELIKGQWKEFCETNQIRQERSLPYHQSQNGVAERAIGVICAMARALLFTAGLPASYWCYATATATYIKNRTPTAANEGMKTPHELFIGYPPDVGHIRTFGCKAHINQRKETVGKMDPRTQIGILLGYDPTTKDGYLVYLPHTRQLVLSRDVVFDEAILPGQEKKPRAPPAIDLIYPQRPETSVSEPLPAIEDIHDDNNEPHQHQETNDAQDDMTIIEEDGNGQEGEEDTDEQQTRTTRTTDERRIPGRVYKDHFFDHPDLLFVNEDGEMTEDPSEDDKTADDPSLPQLFQPTIPKTYNQAIKSAAADQWKEAMDREMKSIEDLGVFGYVPANAATTKIISCRWVFALKPDKYKARIVARGFEQDGNQVDNVFSPTPSYHIVRSAFALANQLNLEIHQMDINTAFLNAPLDKPVFMRCPPGYEKPGHVVRLRKALYGLKEAPRAWNITLHNQLLDRGFVRHPQEPCVYLHKDNNILLVVFVDDILIVSEQEGVTWFKQQLSSVFATKDLGEVDVFLGLKIIRDRQERTLQITQPQYIDKMLKRFSMENANPVDFPCASGIQLTSEMSPKTDEEKTKMKKVPYRQLVGALMFCSVTCRPDIAYVVKELARYAHKPGFGHWQAAKRVLRYLSGTKDKGIEFKAEPGKEGRIDLTAFSDSSWADCVGRKSSGGHVVFVCGGPVYWSAKTQPLVTLSSTEAEYVQMSECATALVYLASFLRGIPLFGVRFGSAYLMADNRGAILSAQNPIVSHRTKHIDVRYHYIRQLVQSGFLAVRYVRTSENIADILTKGLGREAHKYLSERVTGRIRWQ